jgi:hypothetical protein
MGSYQHSMNVQLGSFFNRPNPAKRHSIVRLNTPNPFSKLPFESLHCRSAQGRKVRDGANRQCRFEKLAFHPRHRWNSSMSYAS